ncbi:MAG: aminotransferase class IV [Spirochaetaceae bacterium]
MVGAFASVDAALIPAEEATVGIDDIDFAYGYGVYETLKVRKGVLFFAERHEERLFFSASVIGMEHPWRPGQVVDAVVALVRANGVADCNVKVLLIGPRLYVMTLPPLFPTRSDLKAGGRAITFEGERFYPQAKSLSMLVSTIAFRKARDAGAYDALLVNRHGEVTEGTRTNLFATDGRRVYTPPAYQVLAGVTKQTVSEVIRELGIPLEERTLPAEGLGAWEGLFLTSTSTKIMPLRQVDEAEYDIPPVIGEIRRAYDAYLAEYAAGVPRIVDFD